MKQLAETEYAVAIHVQGEKRIEGRVLSVPALTHKVFHRSRPKERLGTGGLSLDERVAWFLMAQIDVAQIHFEDAGGTLYTVDKETFWKEALPLRTDGVSGRIHLPVERWWKEYVWYETSYKKGEPEKFAVEWPPERRTVTVKEG